MDDCPKKTTALVFRALRHIGADVRALYIFAACRFEVSLSGNLEHSNSTTVSGLLLIPLTMAQVALSIANGLRISSTGKPRSAMLYGLADVTVSFMALVAVLHEDAIPIAIVTQLIGAGLGSTMPAAQTMAQCASGERYSGEATAALSFSRSIGVVPGAAITSAGEERRESDSVSEFLKGSIPLKVQMKRRDGKPSACSVEPQIEHVAILRETDHPKGGLSKGHLGYTAAAFRPG